MTEHGNKPLVSVVTPSFNQGKFIGETLSSVMKQDYPRIEHLVLDGGSTDDTINILRNYEDSYNLWWVSEPDGGQSDAINKGFRLAKGEIVYWLNSDDVLFDTGTLSSVVAMFQRLEDTDVIYGDGVFIDEHSRLLRVVKTAGWDYRRLLRSCFIVQPAVFFRRRAVSDNALDEKLHYSMDYEFWLRLGRKYKFAKMNKILTGFRVYEQAKSSAHKDKLQSEDRYIQSKYGQRFGLVYQLDYLRDRLLFGYLSLQGVRGMIGLKKKPNLAFEMLMPGRVKRLQTQLPLGQMLRALVLKT